MKRAIFDVKTRLLMRRDRRAFDQMLRNERLDAAGIGALSDAAASRIALHAFESSPFYRDLYTEAGFSRADVAARENFSALPIVTKSMLRDAGDSMLSTAAAPSRALISQTGGSTGSPLRVRNDAAAPTAPMWWRIYRWWGVHPADDVAFIYRRLRQGREAMIYAAQWWPSRHIHLDARAVTDDAIEEFARTWSRVQPRLLVAYVEGATAVAAHLAKTGRTLPTHAVSVTAAMLQPGQRELLETVFRTPVFDTYRSAEIPWIAAECTHHDGLHVAADQRLVEIVDATGRPAAQDEEGSVIVTDFSNEVYPLVRYEMGDRSRSLTGRCGCGLAFARIAPVQGRIADVLRTPAGRQITGGLSGLFLGDPGAVRQMQIVQAADFSVSIRYVPTAPGEAAEAAERAVRALRDLLGDEVVVAAVEVESIESSGGKARLVISDAAMPL
ncbi:MULTISPECIES: phenylacetate--CoA ligase family protein [unclassified Microbacterium]|uniref:phenylacetate--CoA ligase family protein n=1 Tax=unclassified Microbacterium TaxID=2609290 RepID=UPI000EA875DB|nr:MULTISPECIES: phenylacetate--CoA ligase family protein [unclassified Microbacterium]MBT2484557.1 phenylacetate--CoA ligase family protein [Microbacterium sp. ISL-108]RKN67456.1 phenylacetate--CoA ligase family protein [Microbacterium sp. CGR2]